MTYEEMMILTEQHLESQVFKPPFCIRWCQALIILHSLSIVNIIVLKPDDTSALNEAWN